MESKVIKTVVTELTSVSVNILVSVGSKRHEIILPVDIIDPKISLQLAGAISSSSRLPHDADFENN